MTNDLPTLAKRHLGQALLRLREESGLSREHVAESLGYRRNTIWRIENGQQGTRQPVVEKLCDLYKVSRDMRSQLLRMVVDSSSRGWWEGMKGGVPPKWRMFAESEQTASLIRTWEPEYVPGLLQVPEYLHMLQAVSPDEISPETAHDAWEFRSRRQSAVLMRSDPPALEFVVGEAALRYLRSCPQVQARQTERLIEIGAWPNVDIWVVVGPHPAMTGPFTILQSGHQLGGTFVYLDQLDGCRYVEEQDVVALYERTFKAVCSAAISLEEYLR